MKHAVLALLLLAPLVSSALAQSVITGRVVADESGDPVANARVVANAGSSDRLVTLTGRDGQFSLPVPPGRHGLVATKARFARGQVTVDAGAAGVEIRLRRGAAISGRIIDEFGDPVVAAAVFVETPKAAVAGSTITDDRGEYRIGGLSAGTFNVAVRTIGPMEVRSLGRGRFSANPAQIKTYYPNATTAAEAHPVDINWGDERAGVDLVLPIGRAGFQPFDVGRRGPGPLTLQRLQAARPAAQARTTPPPSGVIRGIVTGAGGLPLPYAVVRLEGSAEPQMVRTLTDGRFEFRGLPRGPHSVSASKVGYFTRDVRVPLQAGETLDDRSLALDPWGIVAGRVFDEHGDPVQGAKVEVLQLRYEGGRRRLVSMSAFGSATDDHGSFRLFGLRPGQYIVSAEVGSAVAVADLPGYARTLYPGTLVAAQGQVLTVAGAEVSGVDFGLVRAPSATVSGRFVNVKDEPAGGSLQLMPSQHSLSVMGVPAGARIYSDGRFEFPNVPPGEYVVQGYRGRLNSWTEGEFGAARVTVADGDVRGVVLRTSPGSSIRGRILFEPTLGAIVPNPWDVGLSPLPVDYDLSPQNNFASANVGPDGTFVIEGINGPRRLEVLTAPPGWVLKEIRSGGINVTDQVLSFGTAQESLRDVEVVLTDRVSELIGSVRDDRARPMASATMIVFSTDRSQWYPRSRYVQRNPTEGDGTFSISGLPAGQYYAAAVQEVPTDGDDAWQEPAFLESLIPGAISVLIADGGRASANFRLSGR
jgi:protocatechuate 3,4-dioxygenase beta subunit